MISTQPLWPRASQMSIQEPQRDQRVSIDNCQTEKLRRQPIQSAQRETTGSAQNQCDENSVCPS